ncbi:hypothetical protein [Actinoalloteichus hymeniacidonis]|uniref:Uncharacterized protein n=1 Tax=Actinoalloteichus hymeniacidonis TaxID=340345 RepID=A0AAC9MVD7_9PSEU|nr:hypothetical protein [Actinoalloteichus hymeniacidonis]AOS61093.1 hypothetical protein TL08_01260 [Actinoalloteichus hymeniacidonis]MBB5910906.1 hypothetical protein [Actinoalloteichus hymeniacidonis]
MTEEVETIESTPAAPGVRGCLGRIALIVVGSLIGTVLTVVLGLAILLPWRSENTEVPVTGEITVPLDRAPTVELRIRSSLVSTINTVWIGDRIDDDAFYGVAVPVPGNAVAGLRAEWVESGLRLHTDEGFEVLVPGDWMEGGR